MLQPDLLFNQLLAIFSQIIAIVLILAIFVAFAYMLFQAFKHRNKEKYALGFVTLMIRLPHETEIKVDAAEQMFAGLYSIKHGGFFHWLKPEDLFAFEIIALKEEIAFYVSCPAELRDLVEKQIHGAYPVAEITEVDEVNIFSQKGRVAFTTLVMEKANFYPIKTYKDLPTDSLSLLTSALSKMGDGEGASLQLLFSPEGKSWQKKGRSFIQSEKKREADPEKATYGHDPKEMEAISTKIEKPGFRLAIKIVVNSPTEHTAESHLNNIAGAFAQYTSAHNSFKKGRVFFKHLFMIDFIYRYLPLFNRNTCILNTEELATIFHLPNKTVETHHIKWLNAKNAPAPSTIPNSGLFLGKSLYRGDVRKVYISEDDRRRHMYIVGKTGTGKSEFLKEMILQDIENGKGVCAIDPHGEFVEDILQLMPPERAEDVIYFNPSDLDRPMGMNMMEA
ncbi:MAG TPA: DUF87 domain-containing protein, partial [Candidatus Woesebacteria bacterium]|nr:DUF87 domain-containing protein [Candidatus Woesebacteria bacterium]